MEIVLAALGVMVPIIAALWEFVVVGRKRLGYRVQMDTTATDAAHSHQPAEGGKDAPESSATASPDAEDEGSADGGESGRDAAAHAPDETTAGALRRLQDEQGPLAAPSFVLLRIENNGATHIDVGDYAVLDDDKVGLRVRFPQRRVAGMVITELSDEFLRHSFGPGSGLRVRDDVIELPRVPLNRKAHYKVLAALDRVEGSGPPPAPEIVGGIKGGVGSGRVHETRAQTGVPRRVLLLVLFLVLVSIGQVVVSLTAPEPNPAGCSTGTLTVTGSTAIAPAVEQAADAYERTCRGARITTEMHGSYEGLDRLQRAGSSAGGKPVPMLAFTDGPKPEGYPRLLPRPFAAAVFTFVVNPDTGVQDLSLDQIRRLYAHQVPRWAEFNGADVPVELVGRNSDSGTRRALEQKVLGARERQENRYTCQDRTPHPGAVASCREAGTDELLRTVAERPGAIGYAEKSAADRYPQLWQLRIDGRAATPENVDAGYPFWTTEYVHTYGDPAPDSLAAGFLHYLTEGRGRDFLRGNGAESCTALRDPQLCGLS